MQPGEKLHAAGELRHWRLQDQRPGDEQRERHPAHVVDGALRQPDPPRGLVQVADHRRHQHGADVRGELEAEVCDGEERRVVTGDERVPRGVRGVERLGDVRADRVRRVRERHGVDALLGGAGPLGVGRREHLAVARDRPQAHHQRVPDHRELVVVDAAQVVLDAVHRLQATQAGDLAVRWNCKAGKCGSCSAEINGRPRLMCMTRLSDFDRAETITVTPLRTFPVIRDLVTDVSFNYEKAKQLPAFAPTPRDKDGKRRMMQADVEKLRVALRDGDCSTSVFALCSLKSWVNSTITARQLDPQASPPSR